MDKRLELIQMIVNSDDKGVEKIYSAVHGKSTTSKLTKEKYLDITAEIFAKMCIENPPTILVADDFCMFAAKIYEKISK